MKLSDVRTGTVVMLGGITREVEWVEENEACGTLILHTDSYDFEASPDFEVCASGPTQCAGGVP